MIGTGIGKSTDGLMVIPQYKPPLIVPSSHKTGGRPKSQTFKFYFFWCFQRCALHPNQPGGKAYTWFSFGQKSLPKIVSALPYPPHHPHLATPLAGGLPPT